MAKPIAADIRLPDDSGNAGKRVRTQTRVVGGNTVHEHFYVEGRSASILSIYRMSPNQMTVAAAIQNGTTAGMFYGHMPSAVTGKAFRIRRCSFSTQHSTALATPTAPRLLMRRYTSSGALNTSLLAPDVNDSVAHATPAALFSTVNTGTTVAFSAGPGFASAGIAGALTAVGAYEPCYKDMIDPAANEDDWPVFYPGQGFVIYQDTVGTTADTRKINLQILIDEIETV